MSFYIKRNDTAPSLEAQLIDAEGKPINLDMCGVRFLMKDRFGRVNINRPATIVDAEQGLVRVDWEAGDTSVAGMMKCEFEITFTDGKVLTVPNDGYFLIHIVEDLG